MGAATATLILTASILTPGALAGIADAPVARDLPPVLDAITTDTAQDPESLSWDWSIDLLPAGPTDPLVAILVDSAAAPAPPDEPPPSVIRSRREIVDGWTRRPIAIDTRTALAAWTSDADQRRAAPSIPAPPIVLIALSGAVAIGAHRRRRHRINGQSSCGATR